MNNIIVKLLKDDIHEFQSRKRFILFLIKEFIYIYGVIFILNNLCSLETLNINLYYNGIYIATFIYASLYLYSSVIYGKKNKLINTLPILKRDLFIFFRIDMFIEIFLTKFFPVITSIVITMILQKVIECIDGLKIILWGVIVFESGISIAFMFILYLLNKKYLRMLIILFAYLSFVFLIKYFNIFYMLFIPLYCISTIFSYIIFIKNYRYFEMKKRLIKNSNLGLFKREFYKFFSDKVLVGNYIITFIFTLVFTINIVANDVTLYFIISLMLILPICSCTTACMFSYEGEKIKLIKMLPIKFYKIVLCEYGVALFLTIPIYIIALVVLYINKIVAINYCIIYILDILLICAYKIFIDIQNPVMNYEHTEQLLRNPRKYMMFLKISIGYLPVCFYSSIGIGYLLIIVFSLNFFLILLETKKIKIKKCKKEKD